MPRAWASCGVVILTGRAVQGDGALVRDDDPGDRLDQGGLARAVVAHQGDDLALAQVQARAVKRLDGAVPLGDAGSREHLLDARLRARVLDLAVQMSAAL